MKNQLGIDTIVFGHYAKLQYNSENSCLKLTTSKDEKKDQTYFLCMTPVINDFEIFLIKKKNFISKLYYNHYKG